MSRLWWLTLGGLVVLAVAADILLPDGEQLGDFLGVSFPASHAVFGLAGCVLLIVFSKALGHHWLDRPEDYYESGDRDG